MGLYDIVRFEGVGTDWLLYKYKQDEFNTKSKMVVSTGQIAILVHSGKIEKICEAGTFTLDTELLPFIKSLTKMVYSGKNPYPLEIYFINKRLKLDFFWGTASAIDLIDPVYGVKLRLRARGQFGVRITDYQYFYQTLVGTLIKNNYITFDILRDFFKGFINQKIKKILATQIISNKITYFDIGIHLDEIQETVQEEITRELEKYGLEVSSLSIENVDCPEEDLEHLSLILNKKAELNQLGESGYRTVRGYDVLESAAENNGSAATFMGMGIGMDMGRSASVGSIVPPMNDEKASSSSGFVCPNCGKKLPYGSKFCPECGTKIVTVCPKCGRNVEPGTRFCPECGEKLM